MTHMLWSMGRRQLPDLDAGSAGMRKGTIGGNADLDWSDAAT